MNSWKKEQNNPVRTTIVCLAWVAFFFCWVDPVPAQATVYDSLELGWSSGQDVSTAFAEFLADTAIAGDELRIHHVYRISGTHDLPDDFTITGVGGGGFDFTDSVSDQNRTFLRLGNGNTLRNLTITYLNTPMPGPRGTHPVRGEDFYPTTGVVINDKSDILIDSCKLYGSINHHLKVAGGAEIQILGTHIVGGYWSIYLAGDVSDVVIRNCVIEQCQGDGIKTGRGGAYGVKRVLVDSCVFQDNGRDGIDTTGGFMDSTVRDTIMRRLFSGMDIKSFFESPEHLSIDCMNTGILVEGCTFTDMANAISMSTIDRGLEYNNGEYFLDADSAQIYAPHDMDINDCVFERTGESEVRMLLMKGGHTVRYQNAMFCGEGVGEVKYTNVYETFGPETLSQEVSEALNHSVTGILGSSCEAGTPGDTSVPFEYGPQGLADGVGDDDSGCSCRSSSGTAYGFLIVLGVLVFLGCLRKRADTDRYGSDTHRG